MTRVIRLLVLGFLLAGLPCVASAQSRFISASYARDIRRFSGDTGGNVYDGTAAAPQVSIGAVVSSAVAVQIEVALSGKQQTSTSITVLTDSRVSEVRTVYASWLDTYSALIGLPMIRDGRRVQATAWGGVTFVRFFRRITSDTGTLVIPPVEPSVSEMVDYTSAPTAGVDVAIKAGRHASLLLGLRALTWRATGDLSGLSVRPLAGAQFWF